MLDTLNKHNGIMLDTLNKHNGIMLDTVMLDTLNKHKGTMLDTLNKHNGIMLDTLNKHNGIMLFSQQWIQYLKILTIQRSRLRSPLCKKRMTSLCLGRRAQTTPKAHLF